MIDLPEINFARRLLERHKLVPPIDIAKLAARYARVEYEEIPFSVDGVSLNLKVPGKTPTIIVNSKIPNTRQRFTLAHELGHVVIPWHIGSIVDTTEYGLHEPAEGYWLVEGEANRFAAELLMPSHWLQSLIMDVAIPPEIQKIVVDKGDVSPSSAAVKIIQELPSGYVMCALDETGEVKFSGRSLGTVANAPDWGTTIDVDKMYPYADEMWKIEIKGQNFLWWRLPRKIKFTTEKDGRDWRAILQGILKELTTDEAEKRKLQQSINGLVAYANSVAKRYDEYSPETIYSAAVQRFHSRPEYCSVVSHKDFAVFLRKRVTELFKDNS